MIALLLATPVAGAPRGLPGSTAPAGGGVVVTSYMIKDLLSGGLAPITADVVFRDADGKVLLAAVADEKGHVNLPLDSRGLKYGQRIEATIGCNGGSLCFGAVVGVTPGRSDYVLFLPPLKEMMSPDVITGVKGKDSAHR